MQKVFVILAATAGASIGVDWKFNGVASQRRIPGSPFDITNITTATAFAEMFPTDGSVLNNDNAAAFVKKVTNSPVGATTSRLLIAELHVADSLTIGMTYAKSDGPFVASVITAPIAVDTDLVQLNAVRSAITQLATAMV